jgi:hypothetical protein
MPDLVIMCRDCHAQFIFTDKEQERLQEKAILKEWDRCEPPKRCLPCRARRRAALTSTEGFDVCNEADAFRAWREGYLTIYGGIIAIQEENEFKFARFIMEMLHKGEKVRAVTKLRTAERVTGAVLL